MSPERQLSPEQDAAASISAKSAVTAEAPPSSVATETASKRQSVDGQSQLLTAQAKTVLASTGKATRAVLSHIGDTAWWKKTLSKLQSDDQLLFGYGGDSGARGNVNAGLEFQACHPFYEDIMPSLYIDQVHCLLIAGKWESCVKREIHWQSFSHIMYHGGYRTPWTTATCRMRMRLRYNLKAKSSV
jgi:hypothetical protein